MAKVREEAAGALMDDSSSEASASTGAGSREGERRRLRASATGRADLELEAGAAQADAEADSDDGKDRARRCLGWDMSPEPLPTLQSGFWGTEKVLAVQCGSEGFRAKRGPVLLAFLALAALGGFLGIAIADYYNFAEGSEGASIGCTSRFWNNRSHVDDRCGLYGMDCRPFATEEWSVGRCPEYCLTDWAEPVYGSGPIYGGNGMICASAIHAGVLNNAAGGCFRYRLTGPQMSFEGSERNGVASEGFGWFPRSVEFEAIEGARCNALQDWIDAYVLGMAAVFLLLIRPKGWFVLQAMCIAGFLYLTMTRTSNRHLSQLLNEFSPRLFVILLLCAFLWPRAVRHTMPDPQRFPVDSFVFYFLPFWMGIKLDLILNLDIRVTLTKDVFSSPGYVVGFCLLWLVALPVVVFQARVLYRAGLFFKALFYIVATLIGVLITSLATSRYLTLHFHHWMWGGAGVLLLQGQHRSRVQIVLQGLMLGTLVNGVAKWDIAPLYDNRSGPYEAPLPGPGVYWTGVNVTNTTASLEWALPDVVLGDWNCSTEGLLAFEAPTLAEGEEPTDLELGPLPDSQQGARRLKQAAANDLASTVLPAADTTPFRISMSGVIMFNDLLEPEGGVFSASLDLRVAGTSFLLAVGNDSRESEYLSLSPPQAGGDLPGAGLYDVTNATFADPCARVYALLLARP